MSVEQNRLFFNIKAAEWDSTTKHDPEKIIMLLEKLELDKTDALLDVGTGTGVLLPYLLEFTGYKGNITAIDLAEQMINKAKEKFGHHPIRFITGDVTVYPFANHSYDKIVCYSVFPHFFNPLQTLKRLASLLKENGLLLVAHSEGRETINARHLEHGNSLISHGLPPAAQLAALFSQANLKAIDQADCADYYYVLGKRLL